MNIPRILLFCLALFVLTTSCAAPGTPLPSPSLTAVSAVVTATFTLTASPVPSVTFTPTIQVTTTPTTVMATITPTRTPYATNTRQPTAPPPFELADLIGLGQIAFINETGWISVINADGTGLQELKNPGGSHYRYNDECSISWSPDGKQVAATIDSHIYILNADGSEARKITTELGTDFCINWSPDGKLLAFASDRAKIKHPSGQAYFIDIFTIQPDGSNLTKLTPSDGYCDYPDWSPFSNLIAYQCNVESGGMDIYTVGLNGKRGNITAAGGSWYPNWSPDGALIAYGLSDIYVIPSNGGSDKQLTYDGLSFRPIWSPDGKWIAFTYFDGSQSNDLELIVMDENGDNRRQLTFNQISNVNPSWSPDSKYIVYEPIPSPISLKKPAH